MKIISKLLITTTICTTLATTSLAATPFTDLGDWYDTYVETAYDAGCVSGKTDTQFDPIGYLSMAEFSVMLTKAWYGTELAAEMSLYNEGQWGDDFINTLKKQYTSTSFVAVLDSIDSYSSMTRTEAACVIGMMLLDKEIAKTNTDYSYSLNNFTDLSVNSTEKHLLGITSYFQIMNGKSATSFDGNGTLNRAEACVIISKLLELDGLSRDNFDQSNVAEKPVVETPVVTETPDSSTTTGDLPGRTTVFDSSQPATQPTQEEIKESSQVKWS